MHTLLTTHSLVALNTWGKPGQAAHTFTFGKHQAQLDYFFIRLSQSTRQAKQAHPIENCPVGGWRQGVGQHLPFIATLPFCYQVFRKPPAHTLQADTERIVQLTQVEDPDSVKEIVQFREAVKQKLENLSTTQEIGSVSKIVQSIAAQHFPRTTQTTPTVARWQQPGIKQGIADMWKAWRHYRRSSRDITLQALIGRWRTWAQYTKLYKQHKDQCQTTRRQVARKHDWP